MQVRPMRTGDVDETERLVRDPYGDPAGPARRGTSSRSVAAGPPLGDPPRGVPVRSGWWREHLVHLLEHDAQGCWVAEVGGRMVGAAVSLRRETLWAMSTLVVRDGRRHEGVGGRLLEAALTYSQGCVRGIVGLPPDPVAVRLYHRAGFTIHPTMQVSGSVDRTVLPVVDGVRVGAAGDVDLLDSVDRRTRGAAHGVDHVFLAGGLPLLVADNHLGSGYCYLSPGGGVELLAATSERLAQRLVWEAMARSNRETFTIAGITAEQEWLVDVAMRARLMVHPGGYTALRFMKPPRAYVPSPHFL